MEVKELQIGDWIIRRNVPEEPMQVEKIDNLKGLVICSLDGLGITERICNIEPIPLTPEILEKNGFEKQGFDGWEWVEHTAVGNGLDCLDCLVLWRNDTFSPHLRIESFTLKYGEFSSFGINSVHELQHAFRLCGIEKEIVL